MNFTHETAQCRYTDRSAVVGGPSRGADDTIAADGGELPIVL